MSEQQKAYMWLRRSQGIPVFVQMEQKYKRSVRGSNTSALSRERAAEGRMLHVATAVGENIMTSLEREWNEMG